MLIAVVLWLLIAQQPVGEASAQQRQRMLREGERFPMNNCADVGRAIRAVGRVRPNTEAARAQVRRFIMRRASSLGCTEQIPDTWNDDGSLKS